MLRELLCTIGIACGAVQPDVSGHTIMNLLDQTQGDPELMVPALGSLYEDVKILQQDATGLVLDLWREDQPMAATQCWQTDSLRSCRFTYWDPSKQVEAFLSQASQWTLSQIGPLEQSDPATWTATSASRNVQIHRAAEGAESEAQVVFSWPL